MYVISKDLPSLEEQREKAKGLRGTADDHWRLHKSAEKTAVEHLQAFRDYDKAADKAQRVLNDLEHLAAGMCAALKSDHDVWRPRYERCTNKQKDGTRFCGVHRREAEREAKG